MEWDFNTFWSAYPLRVKRKAAEIAFNRAANKVTMEELMTGVKNYISELKSKEWLHPAHAATWLNGERWTDEYGQPGCDDFEMRAHKRSQIGVSKYQ